MGNSNSEITAPIDLNMLHYAYGSQSRCINICYKPLGLNLQVSGTRVDEMSCVFEQVHTEFILLISRITYLDIYRDIEHTNKVYNKTRIGFTLCLTVDRCKIISNSLYHSIEPVRVSMKQCFVT